MKKVIKKGNEIPMELDSERVLLMMDCRKENPLYSELFKQTKKLEKQVQKEISPFYQISVCSIEGLGIGYAAFVTLGEGISNYVGRLLQEDMIEGMLANCMADQLLFAIEEQMQKDIIALAKEEGVGVAARKEAPTDFRVEDVLAVIGEEVPATSTSGGMLKPEKSMLFFFEKTSDTSCYKVEHDCKNCTKKDCSYAKKFLELEPVNTEYSVLEQLLQKGVQIASNCGGAGICGKCKVRFLEGAPKPCAQDVSFFSKEELEMGYRLACKAYLTEKALVEVTGFEEKMKILTSGNIPDQTFQKPEQTGATTYVIAVDVGTTTLAFWLIEKETGAVVCSETGRNHGVLFGADVLSRIRLAQTKKREQMERTLRQDLFNGIRRLWKKAKIEKEKITDVCIAGNTTMEHFLMGFSTEKLGSYPFTPVSLEWQRVAFSKLFQSEELECKVTVFPGISAFVGADIVSGLYACEMGKKEQISLFVDLGTNGEMALGNRNGILATSVAAGPAFEGGNISCGVPGIEGAIYDVKIENGRCRYKTIGKRTPVGICGSGVLKLTAELLKNGLMDETGTLSESYQESGYQIAPGMLFLQRDIREVQLAKAAVRAGMELLLKKTGITWEEVDTLYLAGGFGNELDVENAVFLGIFPEQVKEKVKPVGNTVLSGLYRYALASDGTDEVNRICDITTEINLAKQKEFEETYLGYLSF